MRLWTSVLILGFGTILFAQANRSAAPNHCTATGDLEIRDFKSTIFHNARKLRILLPAGYHNKESENLRYPVLYMNDGQDLFDVCTSVFGPARVDGRQDNDSANGRGKDRAAHHRGDR